MKTVTERASAYLAKMPVSVSGQQGHATAFSAAVVLVRGFDLSEAEALPLLCRWNEACLPPWRENELRHKLHSAATTACKPAGYLLEGKNRPVSDSSSHPSSSSSRRVVAQHAPATHTVCTSQNTPHPTTPGASPHPAPAEGRAWLRQTWPEFAPLTREDIGTVAKLRGLYPDAVDLAHRHGFLRTAQVQGQRCLVITEGTFAQVRRIDGGALTNRAGSPIKARNLPGSQGAFIGQRWLGKTTHVLLVEGAVGLIEGLAALLLVNTPHPWSILTATSASSRFARDPELLAQLRGREVRIVPDGDEAGRAACSSWLGDLQAAGIRASVHPLEKPCKDLGDVFHLPEHERQQILHHLFLP